MSAPELSPDERAYRAQMALAEAGYPDAAVIGDDGSSGLWFLDADVPNAVVWRAAALAGALTKCWPCFDHDPYTTVDCEHDPLTSPWPEVTR